MSVRNSSGGLVQFYYGDDGLDPAFLEADILPVDLKRNLQHIIVCIFMKLWFVFIKSSIY
jgi:hypothetical protein